MRISCGCASVRGRVCLTARRPVLFPFRNLPWIECASFFFKGFPSDIWRLPVPAVWVIIILSLTIACLEILATFSSRTPWRYIGHINPFVEIHITFFFFFFSKLSFLKFNPRHIWEEGTALHHSLRTRYQVGHIGTMNPAYSTVTPGTEGSHQSLYEDAMVHSGSMVNMHIPLK